jgi:hypothetical protein
MTASGSLLTVYNAVRAPVLILPYPYTAASFPYPDRYVMCLYCAACMPHVTYPGGASAASDYTIYLSRLLKVLKV